jgi:hypothetical protein
MVCCPSSEIIHSLRATLQHIEENLAIDTDRAHLADIKRTILLRIAAIEAVQANPSAETAKGAELPAPTSIAISRGAEGLEG